MAHCRRILRRRARPPPRTCEPPFVLDQGPVHRRDDRLSTQLRCLDREEFADPANEPMEAGFAEPNILIVARDRRQSFDVSVVPTRPLDGHLRWPPRYVVQLGVEALVGASHVAWRTIRLAIIELPKQQGERRLVRHLVLVDVDLEALREVPVESHSMLELCCPFMRSRCWPNLATNQWKVINWPASALVFR